MKPFAFTALLAATGFAVTAAAFSPVAQASEESNKAFIKTGLALSLSYSYQNKSYAEADSEWQIPGALMGGEALPVDKNGSLDDLVINYQYAMTPDSGFQVTGEAHGSNGENEFEFDHYFYKHQWHTRLGNIQPTKIRLEVGRLSAAFSPLANFHASKNDYSEATLTGDIFWGRSFVDNGIRSSLLLPNWTFGLEAWNGQGWLADGGYAADLFARYKLTQGTFTYSAGAWALYSEAENRRDTRYFGGHTHGDVVVTSNDVAFTGNNNLYGIDGSLSWRINSTSTLKLSAHLSHFDQSGDVVESARSAALQSDYRSALFSSKWQFKKHELAARYEVLRLSNILSGDAAVVVGRNTSLDNPQGLDPKRTTIAYRFHYNSLLTARLEWIDEEVSGEDQQRWVAGVVLRKEFE